MGPPAPVTAARAAGKSAPQPVGHSTQCYVPAPSLAAQQLNSKRQNERRAKIKADAKLRTDASCSAPTAKSAKVTKAEPERLLGAVADFWEAKQARLRKSSLEEESKHVEEGSGESYDRTRA